jgi:hypothetical protein
MRQRRCGDAGPRATPIQAEITGLLAHTHVPRLAAVASHLDRMKRREMISGEMFNVERAPALDGAASAFYRAEAGTCVVQRKDN